MEHTKKGGGGGGAAEAAAWAGAGGGGRRGRRGAGAGRGGAGGGTGGREGGGGGGRGGGAGRGGGRGRGGEGGGGGGDRKNPSEGRRDTPKRKARERGAEGGTHKSLQRVIKLDLEALQKMQNKSPDDIVADLISSKCFSATEELMTKQTQMSDDMVFLVVKILARGCRCQARGRLFKLLSLLPQSLFLKTHLESYINRLSVDIPHGLSASNPKVVLENLINLFSKLLQLNPSCSSDLPLYSLSCTVNVMCDGRRVNKEMEKRAMALLKPGQGSRVKEMKKKEEEKTQRRQKPRNGMIVIVIITKKVVC